MFRRQKRVAGESQRSPRRALAVMRVGLLGGWLIMTMLTCAVALSLVSGQASAASTIAQGCVNSTNGTPVATPPVEEPSATVGSTGTGQTPCATITPTVNGGASSLPSWITNGNGSGQNGNLPGGPSNGGVNGVGAPSAPSNPANSPNSNSPNNPPNSSASHNANACSGALCWVQNALSSAGSFISRTWNSASTLEKALLVVAVAVVVVAAVALIVVAVAAALPAEVGAGIAAAATSVWGFLFGTPLMAALTSGTIGAISSLISDTWISPTPTSTGDKITHALFYFALNALSFGAVAWVGKGLTMLGALPWVEDTVTSVFGDTMAGRLLDFLGIKALGGAATRRGTRYLAKLVVGLLAIGVTTGLEVLAAHIWGQASPLPQPTPTEPLISGILWLTLTLPFVGPASRAWGPVMRGVIEDGVKQGIAQNALEKQFSHDSNTTSQSSGGGGAW